MGYKKAQPVNNHRFRRLNQSAITDLNVFEGSSQPQKENLWR